MLLLISGALCLHPVRTQGQGLPLQTDALGLVQLWLGTMEAGVSLPRGCQSPTSSYFLPSDAMCMPPTPHPLAPPNELPELSAGLCLAQCRRLCAVLELCVSPQGQFQHRRHGESLVQERCSGPLRRYRPLYLDRKLADAMQRCPGVLLGLDVFLSFHRAAYSWVAPMLSARCGPRVT